MKKFLLLFFTFHFSLFILKAQGSWSPRTTLPDSGRYGGIGFSIGNYGYIGLGLDVNHIPHKWLKDFWQFDPSINTWTRKADFPGKARFCPATFVIGNKGYVITGVDSATLSFSVECWQYEPATDNWTQKADFPGDPRGYDVGFAIGGKGYVGIGGQIYTDYQKDFWAYDTATDTWSQIADFPGISRIGACGFAVNGKGYVCFGADSTVVKFYNDVWQYDTSNNTWAQKTSCPGLPIYEANGFVIGNNIYVGTGSDSAQQEQPYFWQYNTLTDAWAQEASYPGISKTGCSAFAVADSGYLGLGFDSVADCFNNLFRFLPDSVTTTDNEIPTSVDILIYPNPFNSFCIISLSANTSESIVSFILYDMEGRVIKANVKKSSNRYILSRDGLLPGIYILSVQFNNQIIHKKLVITN